MGAGKDEDSLVGVRQQNLLVITLGARVEPDDGPLPILDLFDRPASICRNGDADPVSNGRDVSGSLALLQLAAQLTNSKALPGFNCKETGLGFDNQALQKSLVCQAACLLRGNYGLGVLVGSPPISVGSAVRPKFDSNQ